MKVLFTARMVTRPRCTGDEYTAELKFLLGRLGVPLKPVRALSCAAWCPT